MKNFFQTFNEQIDKELNKCETCEATEELEEAATSKNLDIEKLLFNTPADKLVFKQAQEIASEHGDI